MGELGYSYDYDDPTLGRTYSQIHTDIIIGRQRALWSHPIDQVGEDSYLDYADLSTRTLRRPELIIPHSSFPGYDDIVPENLEFQTEVEVLTTELSSLAVSSTPQIEGVILPSYTIALEEDTS